MNAILTRWVGPTLARVRAWLLQFRRREAVETASFAPPVSALIPEPEPEPEPAAAAPSFPVPTPRRRGKGKAKAEASLEGKVETLAELLEHLEQTFDSTCLPTDRLSLLNKDTILGLKKIGVHVPHPWFFRRSREDELTRVDDMRVMPTMISISFPVDPSARAADAMTPAFMFATREKKLHWRCQKKPGVPYHFGFGYRIDGKLWWHGLWAVVADDGEVSICDILEVREVPIRHRNGKSSHYTTSRWEDPSDQFVDIKSANTMSPSWQSTANRVARDTFVQVFNWWTKRPERWSVSVNRAGQRVTFSIDKELTKAYFVDRDKSIKARDGRAKKIIHFVQQHTRSNGSTVREHVRGLREFDWNDFHCIVTAPKLNGELYSVSLDVPTVEEEDMSSAELSESYSVSKVGHHVAQAEDGKRPIAF